MICDLAETYSVYDYESLPLPLVATLVFGLREDSRLKMKLSGVRYPQDTYTLAMILDSVNHLLWMQSGKGPKPKRMMDLLLGKTKVKKNDIKHRTYQSPDEFTQARDEILTKGGN